MMKLLLVLRTQYISAFKRHAEYAEGNGLIDTSSKIKEERPSNSQRIKEEWFDKLIDVLKTKLKENEIVTKQHDDALSECKLYIKDISIELEKC